MRLSQCGPTVRVSLPTVDCNFLPRSLIDRWTERYLIMNTTHLQGNSFFFPNNDAFRWEVNKKLKKTFFKTCLRIKRNLMIFNNFYLKQMLLLSIDPHKPAPALRRCTLNRKGRLKA